MAGQVERISVRIPGPANGAGVPPSYLAKTLQVLVRAKVLRSVRGRKGGFSLAATPERLLLSRIIAPFDSLTERRHCLLGRPECSDRTACVAHHAWKITAAHIAGFFRTTSLADVSSGMPFVE